MKKAAHPHATSPELAPDRPEVTPDAQTTDDSDGGLDGGEDSFNSPHNTVLRTPTSTKRVKPFTSVQEAQTTTLLAKQTSAEVPRTANVTSEALDDGERPSKRRRTPGSPKRPFPCSLCLKTFTRRATLNNHQRQHTGERPFRCGFSECGESFAQDNDKKRHERSHGGEKAFHCDGTRSDGSSWGCGKAFARKDGLLEHHHKTDRGRKCLARRDERLELGNDG
jgi:uncharacterized Zn-finger protein